MIDLDGRITRDDLFLGRPGRLARGQHPVLVENLRKFLVQLVRGHSGTVSKHGTKHVCLEEMDLLESTPFGARAAQRPQRYGVDVWAQEPGQRYAKVASLWWDNDEGDVEVVLLKRGKWIARLHAIYNDRQHCVGKDQDV
jgi:hypothetical protein